VTTKSPKNTIMQRSWQRGRLYRFHNWTIILES